MSKRIQEAAYDLGRLTVLLSNICEHKIFETFERFSKHYTLEENLEKLNEEQKTDLFWDIQCHVKHIEELICDCVMIAKGHDALNDSYDQ